MIIILATFQKSLVFAFYELEKDYVIEKLCVNKNVKDSCCFGKCFLEKQTSEKEAKGIIISLLKNFKEDFFIEKNLKLDFAFNSNKDYPRTINDTFPENFPIKIFHPPSAFLL